MVLTIYAQPGDSVSYTDCCAGPTPASAAVTSVYRRNATVLVTTDDAGTIARVSTSRSVNPDQLGSGEGFRELPGGAVDERAQTGSGARNHAYSLSYPVEPAAVHAPGRCLIGRISGL